MVEIDMNKEPADAMLTGINLWEVRACKSERSQKGDPKLVVKFQAVGTEIELTDHIMLGGGGWGIGKAHLLALGVPPGYTGSLDPLDFIGRKVWLATHVEERQGLATKGPNAGKMMTFRNLRVDINALENKGYQAEANVPAGATRTGDGPDENAPF